MKWGNLCACPCGNIRRNHLRVKVVVDDYSKQWEQLHGLYGTDDCALQVGDIDLQTTDARGAQVYAPQTRVREVSLYQRTVFECGRLQAAVVKAAVL